MSHENGDSRKEAGCKEVTDARFPSKRISSERRQHVKVQTLSRTWKPWHSRSSCAPLEAVKTPEDPCRTMSTITEIKTEPERPLSLHDVKSTEYEVDDLPAKSPEELVYLAVKKLTSINVELINFRTTLYKEMNVPLMIIDYTYLVPDEFLLDASCPLLELGLPIDQPASFIQSGKEGDFMKLGEIYRITRSSLPGKVRYLILRGRPKEGLVLTQPNPTCVGDRG
ncbi:hypothetical protein K435DRAFT_965915 [Dendrothele bispora CBS 962.96]|uniref:Uncharacterized protein n=1 Tax=Dendrothele bispora (strain CBS 962.96) TaxID=1314807 RepID=A0A4S8M482_DENBC|nr:hypothetical protein K435DRAFT_965915 [Dendrothele bispora CBS 962.96]